MLFALRCARAVAVVQLWPAAGGCCRRLAARGVFSRTTMAAWMACQKQDTVCLQVGDQTVSRAQAVNTPARRAQQRPAEAQLAELLHACQGVHQVVDPTGSRLPSCVVCATCTRPGVTVACLCTHPGVLHPVGTWLENTSRAGVKGADPLCAKANWATACSGRSEETSRRGSDRSARRRHLY